MQPLGGAEAKGRRSRRHNKARTSRLWKKQSARAGSLEKAQLHADVSSKISSNTIEERVIWAEIEQRVREQTGTESGEIYE